MKIRQYEVWIADLNPQTGTEAGKVSPVLVVQTNLLNQVHPSTIVFPITTKVKPDTDVLRVHLKKGDANLLKDCDVMIDQIRAIDNKRLTKKIGDLPQEHNYKIRGNIKTILDLD